MGRPRTTARALFLAFAGLGMCAGAATAKPLPPGGTAPKPPTPKPKPAPKPPPVVGSRIVFPVVGKATYTDDYGDARSGGSHAGNDIMAAKRSPAVAAEAGTVKFHTTSARAGCMLYLHGRSGTEYLYIHLNNDLTKGNDNTGRCVAGVSYAPGLKNGAKVKAGQPIGLVGDSGDANGGASHLHFEVHPKGGSATNPYPYLRRARKLLFAVTPGKPFVAALRGKVVSSQAGTLALRVDQVRSWPGGLVPSVNRKVDLTVSPEAVILDPLGALLATAQLESLRPGRGAVAWTAKAPATLSAALGQPFKLIADKVVLGK
jgi:peptidoglycan LD-endopeptidase LytH